MRKDREKKDKTKRLKKMMEASKGKEKKKGK
jgi:hypothetical protein